MNKSTLLISAIGIVIIIAAVVIFSGSSSNNLGDGLHNASVDSSRENLVKAPDFVLRDYEGNTVSLPDFSGKPLVLNSWAVWCPFCREELDDFAQVQKEFGDAVAIIAIDRAESLEKAKGFTDEIGVTDEMLFLLDPNDSFYRAIGGFSMPETIFVNAGGEIVFHKRGPMDAKEIRERIQELL